MSDALYFTRLRWDSRAGIAKMHGHLVLLSAGPDLGAGPVHAIDYTPEVGVAEIQPRACDPRRDMLAAEIAAADRLLAELLAVV